MTAMTVVLTLESPAGPYEKSLHALLAKMPGRTQQDQAATTILSLLAQVSSEHSLSLAIRTIRARPASSPFKGRPSEDAIRAAAKALTDRNDTCDLAVANVLTLLADFICEVSLRDIVKGLDKKSARLAA